MSILPSIWMDNRLPLCSSSTFFPSSRFVRGTFRGVGWGGRREGRGWGTAGRGVGVLSPSVTPPSPPLSRGCGSAAERAAESQARGDAGVRVPCQLRAPEARWPPELGAEPGARSRPSPAPCALGSSPGCGSPAPGERAPPWSHRTKTPRRRRRRWRRIREGLPRPAGWWCKSARRRAPCAPPSPICPSRWRSSASSSTLSCRDWVRHGGRDPRAPGPAAEGRQGRGLGPSGGARGCKRRPALPAPPGRWQQRVDRRPGGRRAARPAFHLLPPVNEVVLPEEPETLRGML